MKYQVDKKKCSPLLQHVGTCTSCHQCQEKGTFCSFGQTISERDVQEALKEPSTQELSKKPSFISGYSAQPSVLPAKRRRIMETCIGNDEADESG
jgi:hypothetical protein